MKVEWLTFLVALGTAALAVISQLRQNRAANKRPRVKPQTTINGLVAQIATLQIEIVRLEALVDRLQNELKEWENEKGFDY